MRSAGQIAGSIGGAAQLAIAFMGYAIGGMSAIVVVLALDALLDIAGALVAAKRPVLGAILMFLAGVGAAVALFWSTYLEIGVIVLLLIAVVATLASSGRVKMSAEGGKPTES